HVGVVVRLERDHLVARLYQRDQRGGDRLGRAGRHQDLGVRVVGQVVEPPLVFGDGGAQFRYAGAWRILIAPPVQDRVGGRLRDVPRPVRVGKALAEVDRS